MEKQMYNFIDRLPNHILQQIFDRLSSIDLTSCWYVSKSWRYLVKDSKYETKTPHNFILHGSNLCYMDLGFDTMKIVNHFKIPWLAFVNSCNCLLSFRNSRSDCVYILNPTTSEYLKLPEPTGKNRVYGFGFSKKSNEYKMIHLSNEGSVHVCVVDVNPGNHMTWKNIGLLPYHRFEPMYFPCVYFDGALYWIAYVVDDDDIYYFNYVIICRFDIEDEKFHTITLPIDMDVGALLYYKPIDPFIEIGVLGDDFYLLYSSGVCQGDLIIEIWLMKENGVNDYLWTKHLVIQLPRLKSYTYVFNKWIYLIQLCENGDILMVYDNSDKFLLYDPLTKSFRDVKYNFDGKRYLFPNQRIQTLSFSSLKKLLREGNVDSVS